MADASSSRILPPPIVPFGTQEAALAAGDALVINDDVGPITHLSAFSIRNGDTTLAKSLLIRPTVSAIYHWCPISGLDPQDAISQTAAFIRVAAAQISLANPADKTDAQRRKMAIALGTVRAVVTSLYEIADSDLIPGERARPMLVATKTADGRIDLSIVQNATAQQTAALKVVLNLTDQEKSAIAAIHMCAIGLPACQGFSLLMTGHHYLSDVKSHSRRCFKVIEQAHWTTAAIKDWFDDNAEILRDTIWHKSTHPLNMNLKIAVSQSDSVKEMIIKAGAGAAASRLPAVESELRRAKSYRTLLQTVRAMYEEIGGVTNFIVLDEAIAAVEFFPYGVNVTSPHGYPTVPVSVSTRDLAIKHLENVCNRCDDVVGHAWGFFVALDDRAQMMSAAARTSTLRTAFSLTKLDTVSPAAFRAGMAFYEDYAAMKATKRQRGEYSTANLLIAPVNERGVEMPAGTTPEI